MNEPRRSPTINQQKKSSSDEKDSSNSSESELEKMKRELEQVKEEKRQVEEEKRQLKAKNCQLTEQLRKHIPTLPSSNNDQSERFTYFLSVSASSAHLSQCPGLKRYHDASMFCDESLLPAVEQLYLRVASDQDLQKAKTIQSKMHKHCEPALAHAFNTELWQSSILSSLLILAFPHELFLFHEGPLGVKRFEHDSTATNPLKNRSDILCADFIDSPTSPTYPLFIEVKKGKRPSLSDFRQMHAYGNTLLAKCDFRVSFGILLNFEGAKLSHMLIKAYLPAPGKMYHALLWECSSQQQSASLGELSLYLKLVTFIEFIW
eukprot:CAMPEP_0201560360 /NCGR_PEP_ID=MMETSP0173_2-20130828/78231_1 /ASSEMBLY_ACC=CAM_ASM_000268 /TAXON_ID=218659 /ORGANISM="Vexillifera sp., Strain DIVA3 564/2" /LENGTH=318 /DNA_ID=CAMNT_0047974807 /DNA_START=97 /DNA_END=1050 /DNA_ORIENTATION=-